MKDLSIWQRKNISNNREILTNYSQTSQKHLPCRNGVSWPVLVLFCSPVLHLLDFASELSRTLQLLSQAKCGKQTNKQINISHSESLNCRDSKPLFSWMQRNENSSALFEWRVAKKQRFSFLDLTKHKFFWNMVSSGKVIVKRESKTNSPPVYSCMHLPTANTCESLDFCRLVLCRKEQWIGFKNNTRSLLLHLQ